MAAGTYYLNTSGTDNAQTSGSACLKAWLAAGGRSNTGFLVKFEIAGGVKKTIVGH